MDYEIEEENVFVESLYTSVLGITIAFFTMMILIQVNSLIS